MRILLILTLTLLCSACDHAGRARTATQPSEHVRPEFRSAFRTVAPTEYLGAGWEEFNGADGVRRIWATGGGDRALILLRGEGSPALWLDHEKSKLAQPVRFDSAPLHVDAQTGVAYTAQGGRLLKQTLPDGSAEVRFGTDAEGEVLAASTHPLDTQNVWLILGRTAVPVDRSAEVDITEVADSAFETLSTMQGLTAIRLTGAELVRLELGPAHIAEELQLVALPGGKAAATIGGRLLLLDPDSGASVGEEVHRIYGDVLLAADMTQPVAWVYAAPQGASSGTGREEREELPGALLAFDANGELLTEVKTGQVRFSQLSGDWSNTRALLTRDGVGVLLAQNLSDNTSELSWALRNGGDAQLHLLGHGAQLWAVLPDGISGILAHKLVALRPQLLASQVLPREQVKPVRTAVEALGWDWKHTVISPLSAQPGRITLFDSATLGSELAELDWSQTEKQVCRLLAARPATDADAKFAALDPAAQQESISAMLTALGWPDVQAEEPVEEPASGGTGVPTGEATEAVPPTDITLAYNLPQGGTFTLWQSDSVLLQLDAASTTP